MLSVVPPVTIATTARLLGRTVANVLTIGVIYKVIIIIYIYVVVSSPSRIAAPTSSPSGPHGYSNAKRNCHPRGIVPRRWIVDGGIRIHRGPVNHDGVVARNVNHLRVGLLDHNDLLVLDYGRFNLHLVVGF
jgi:hypothetical protein